MVLENLSHEKEKSRIELPLEFDDHIEAAKHYFAWNDEWRSKIQVTQEKINSGTTQSNRLSRQFLIVGRTIEMIVNGVQGRGYDPMIANYLENLGYPQINAIARFNEDGMRIGVDPKKLNEAKIWLGNAYGDLLQGKATGDMSTFSELNKVESMKETDEIYFAELSHRYGERMHVLNAFRSRMLENLPRIAKNSDTWEKQWQKERRGEPIILFRGQQMIRRDKKAYEHTLTAVGLRKADLSQEEIALMSDELMRRKSSIDWETLALGHSSRSTAHNQDMVDPLLSCSASNRKASKYGEVVRLKVPPEFVIPMAYIAEKKVMEIELKMRKYTTNPDYPENRRLSDQKAKWIQHLEHDEEYMVIGYVRPEWVMDADVREKMETVEN